VVLACQRPYRGEWVELGEWVLGMDGATLFPSDGSLSWYLLGLVRIPYQQTSSFSFFSRRSLSIPPPPDCPTKNLHRVIICTLGRPMGRIPEPHKQRDGHEERELVAWRRSKQASGLRLQHYSRCFMRDAKVFKGNGELCRAGFMGIR